MELAEVYRVTYEGPDVKLRGIIVCKDEENGYQYLFKDQDMEDDDDDIEDDDVKHCGGPSKPLISHKDADKRQEVKNLYINEKAEKQSEGTSKPLMRSLDRIIHYEKVEKRAPLIGRAENQFKDQDSFKIYDKVEMQFGATSKLLIGSFITYGKVEKHEGTSKPLIYEQVEKQSEGTSKPLISNTMLVGYKGADKRRDSIRLKVKNLKDDDINNTMLKYNTFQGYKDADKRQDLDSKQLIKSMDHIIPNAPIKSSIRAKDGFLISFYLFGTVYENITFKYPSSRPEKLNVPRIKYIQSEDGFRYLQVFYAIFDNAVEARVKVTLTNNSGLFNLYGVIAARTSAIRYRAYSSLIFCKRRGRGQKIKVYPQHRKVIMLSRDVVAVPLGHQLILEFGLYGCDNDERLEGDNDEMLEEDSDRIVKKTLMFDASEEGTSTACIHCSKCTLKVVVKWCSKRKPVEAQAQAN